MNEQEAYHQLATAVLEKAVKDWRKSQRIPAARKELLRFFMSDMLDLYCDLAHVSPDWLLQCLKIKYKYLEKEDEKL